MQYLHEPRLFTHINKHGKLVGYPERYSHIKVDKKYTTLMFLDDRPMPTVGEIWLVILELNCSNKDLRKRGHSLFVGTEVRLSSGTHDKRDGHVLLPNLGGQNVTAGAHHHQVSRSKATKWTKEMIRKLPKNPRVKLIVRAASDAAIKGDRLEITLNKGTLQLLRFVPDCK